MKLNAATTRLITHALNNCSATLDEDALRFEDSFGELRLPIRNGKLYAVTGEVIGTLADLHQRLLPAPGCNSIGLVAGTILTPLGLLEFDVKRSQVSNYPPRWQYRVAGKTERSLRIGNVVAEGVSIYHYHNDTSLMNTSLHFRRPGERGWTSASHMPASVTEALSQVNEALYLATITPASLDAAYRDDMATQISKAQEQVRKAQDVVDALQRELHEYSVNHESNRNAAA